jgi:pimeloyl-ACP methyl ester carboxylesterase
MPYALNKGVRIWWEQEGSGEALLMIMGLSFSLAMWREMRGIMARHFRTILFDNRGVGKSDVPIRPWSMRTMARDAAAVLDAAEFRSAHVLGVSMGGMIAQELALLHPDRVRKLVLGCTQCGGPGAVRPDFQVYRTFARPFTSYERRMAAFLPLIYAKDTPAERIEQDRAVLRANHAPLRGSILQIGAILRWKCHDRLPRIASPTLVIHGDADRLVPVQNGRLIAGRIPGARLVELEGAGHIFPTDQPERSIAEMLGFLLDSPGTLEQPGERLDPVESELK